jgi:hypothetical protein
MDDDLEAVAYYKDNISVFAWGHLEKLGVKEPECRKAYFRYHEEFRGVKTAKSKPYTSPKILPIVTNTSAFSVQCNMHVSSHLCHRVTISFTFTFLGIIPLPLWTAIYMVQAQQFSSWFYIVTPSCQAPDGWIRDPT